MLETIEMARGPAYPYIDLQKAVDLAEKAKNYIGGRRPVPIESLVKEAWGYSPKSSSGIKIVAAMRYFGLMEDVQDSEPKAMRLTDRAMHILVAHDGSKEKESALKEAALSPKHYKYCWDHWQGETPPGMRTDLLLNIGFIDTTVDQFIRDYKATIEYAGLLEDSRHESSLDIESAQSGDDDELAKQTKEKEQAEEKKAIIQQEFAAKQDLSVKMREASWPLDEGDVVLRWPAEMSNESLDRLEAWLDFLKTDIRGSSHQKPVKPHDNEER